MQNDVISKEKLNVIKRESKSLEAIQQGALIGLLNSIGFSFEFRRPERFASKTIQYLVITNMYFNNQLLDFGKTVDEYCEKEYIKQMSSATTINERKTIKRRKDLNRAALAFNWLVDYAEQFGYQFERRQVKSSKMTLQMVKIKDISINKQKVLSANDLPVVGKQLNEYLISLFDKKEKSSFLPQFDKTCMNFFNTKTEEASYESNCTQQNTMNTNTTNFYIY